MKVEIFVEWSYELGIDAFKVLAFTDSIGEEFEKRVYGNGISTIGIVLICRPQDFRQRKRFLKNVGRFEYDILLDFESIKNAEIEEKKRIIKGQIVEVSEQTFSKYKFEDFDKRAFIGDLKEVTDDIEW